MIVVLIAAIVGAAQVSAPTELLKPTTSWQIDYGDSQCTAARSYSPAPGEEVTLAFVPAPVLGAAELDLIRTGGPAASIERPVNLENTATSFKASMIDLPTGRGKAVGRITLKPDEYARIARDGGLSIRFPGFEHRFALANMAGVSAELDKCVAGLKRLWSMTPDDQARIKTPARAVVPVHSLFADIEYPPQAIREEAKGKVKVRMMVDEKGAVKKCVVTSTSGNALLDATACYTLERRARFNPALGQDGKAVRSFVDDSIGFELHNY